MAFESGQSGIVVPVPAAEPVVSRWRERFDASAAAGVPAHVTVLFPFLPQSLLSADVLRELAGVCAGFPSPPLMFRRCARFPGVLYLVPEPSEPLRALTEAVAGRWPQAPPYGGVHNAVIPHLTVAHDVDDATLDVVEADVTPRLPCTATVSEAVLLVFDGVRWRHRMSLPLG